MAIDIQAELLAARRQLMQVCQHPEAQHGVCDQVIQSHTIPRASLSQIAVAGHVVQLNFWDRTSGLRSTDEVPKIESRRQGVGDASTIPIFCAKHDKATFAPIESGKFQPDARNALLFHYRAAVRQRVNSEYARRGYERVWSKAQALPEPSKKRWLEELAPEVVEASESAARHHRYKLYCDELLTTKGSFGVRAVFVEFEELPHFMCCGVFDPCFDFRGRSLQGQGSPFILFASELDPVALTMIASDRGGFAVLTSIGAGVAAERFLASFASLPDRDKGDAVTRLAYSVVENVYFAPRWWDAKDSSSQKRFLDDANNRHGRKLPDDVLATREPRLADWNVVSVHVATGEG